MVVGIVAAEHLGVEVFPHRMPVRRGLPSQREGMAGGADHHQRAAGRHVSAEGRQLVGRGGPAADTQQHEVVVFRLLKAGKIVAALVVRCGDRIDRKPIGEVGLREGWQCLPRVVLLLGDHQQQPRPRLASGLVAASLTASSHRCSHAAHKQSEPPLRRRVVSPLGMRRCLMPDARAVPHIAPLPRYADGTIRPTIRR